MPYITHIINWGAPNTIEELVQQTGRAGREGRFTSKCIDEYDKNEVMCHRLLLLSKFLQ